MKTINVEFQIELEQHNREQFQKEGHMLFALYWPAGPRPDDKPIRRKWEGEYVFIATLNLGPQTLRVMSDSEESVLVEMRASIANTLRANTMQKAAQEFDYQQLVDLNKERNEMAEFLQAYYANVWAAWQGRKRTEQLT
jgi:hypothetical protein